jgi:2-polyprenyl-6-methoxyphenol hydroxylase-like FAD-dependent oxidoreductase
MAIAGASSNMRTGRAAVIGGSVSGLLCALALRRCGWVVDVYEKVGGELAGRGAGIVVQPQLSGVFRTIGLNPGADLGVTVTRRKMLDRAGRVVSESLCPQIMTSWDRVYRMLREAFSDAHYHRGMELTRIEHLNHSVRATFAGSATIEVDLLIGADGIRSTVREHFLPSVTPTYAGYVAWRGLVHERAISPGTHRDLFEFFSFCLPPGEQMLGYPVAGPDNDLRPGHRRYNFVWYRPAEEATELRRLLTDATGAVHSLSIPPPLVHSEVIAQMRDAAARLLAPQFAEIVNLATPFLQPIYDIEVPQMAFGRVVILGDAAFVARPHVGAGVAKAAEDAIALAHAVEQADRVEPALRAFEAARIGIGRRIIERARHLGAYIQATQRTDAEREHAARHGTADAVLRETALLDFLAT